MRARSLLVLAATALLAATATSGVFDPFVAVLDTRATDPSLRPKQARAIESARLDVTTTDLLLSQARAARTAERRIRSAFAKTDPLRTAAAQTADGLADALAADAAALGLRKGTLGDPQAEKRLDTSLRAATRTLGRVGKLKTTPSVLNALVSAATSLRKALPPQPDFTLPDANPVSSTRGQDFTPRGYPGRVTAWYFIHTT